MSWPLLSLFGVAVGSGVLPVFSVELYLVGLAAARPDLPWFWAGLVTGIGHVLGKLVHYYAARGVLDLPWVTRRLTSSTGRFARWFRHFQDTCAHRPWWSFSLVLLSASVGIPPYTVLVVVAGAGRLPLPVLLPAALLGRVARFCVLASGGTLLGTTLLGWHP
ncbi:membrane protein YqaA with SNARE-associated domain [Crossiella equi]|uniref:Membrane protein YqaA with SNARE-associated domain n=1 Tax=Crossiella equi TaxID=130796 RepID=A0ABS5AI50_9PSEU|nr:VTT domain-containing protein [Crossiella equi]MBP2475952.1 membrane protein YqaA with SNARE-associated domain [Crossiella equi]